MNKFPIALYNAYIKMMMTQFSFLKEEATKAFHNAIKFRNGDIEYFIRNKVGIDCQFVWRNAPEGYDYWRAIHLR